MLLSMQRSAGNRAVRRLLGTPIDRPTSPVERTPRTLPAASLAPLGIQAKLAVNAPGDAYEREADRVADQVTRTPDRAIQRECGCGGTTGPTGECDACRQKRLSIQRKTATGDARSPEVPPIVGSVLRSAGQPLDAATRGFMESRFGHDFSAVRVHVDADADASAASLQAHAYTSGAHVVFAGGRYAPSSAEGRTLLAHELTHVVQQRAMPAAIQRQPILPGEGMKPPGDCEPGDYAALRGAVLSECKGAGGRGCDSTMGLDQIEENIAQNARCIAARRTLDTTCFKGGDQSHRDQLQEAVSSLMNCHRAKEKVEERATRPDRVPALKRMGVSALIGAGLGAVTGAVLGASGGTLVAPGFGTVGGGVAGAIEGAEVGAAAGAFVGAAGQAFYEWLRR